MGRKEHLNDDGWPLTPGVHDIFNKGLSAGDEAKVPT